MLNSDEEDDINYKRRYLAWLQQQNTIRDCVSYAEDKQKLMQIVDQNNLHFYFQQKYRSKKRINRHEVRIIALQKEISIRAAQDIADDFNLYMQWISCNEVLKVCKKLFNKITLN